MKKTHQGILEYDLNDTYAEMAFKRAIASKEMALVLWEIAHNLQRNMVANMENAESGGVEVTWHDATNKIFSEIEDMMHENGIIIDNLID